MEVKICPKVNESLEGYKSLKQYITDAVEIQMLTYDLRIIQRSLHKLVAEQKSIKYITVHVPIRHCAIEYAFCNNMCRDTLVQLIQICNDISRKHSITINILTHCNTSYETMKFRGWDKKLWSLLILCSENVNLLLENTIAIHVNTFGIEPTLDVVIHMKHDHLKMCLDICHLHYQIELQDISEQNYFANFKEDVSKYITQVHFSNAANALGLYPIESHGNIHNSLSGVRDDINLLVTLGLPDKYIVPEVYEDDYETRVNEIKEIKYLKEVGVY